MSLCKEKIERFEIKWAKESDAPWRKLSYSRKWRKNQMNRFIRRKPIDSDDIGGKQGRKPTRFWEY